MSFPAELKLDPASGGNSAPAAASAPPTVAPRRYPWRVVLALGLVIAGVAAAIFAGHSKPRSAAGAPSTPSRTGTALAHNIRLKGTTEAVRMRAIVAPMVAGEHVGMLTITRLVASGSRVKPGDLLAEFDRQAELREFIDKQSEQAKLDNQVLEEQAKEAAARAKDETELREAENKLAKAELEIGKLELLSRIGAEEAQEDLEEAKATLAQLKETFQLKRQRAQASIRLLEIQRDRAREIMDHARENADRMQIRSPLEGVVVLNSVWKQGTMGEVQEGDQLGPGVTFMQVVDPSLMQVRVLANQEDFLSLAVGQSAKVHLDAYPELEFAAKIEEMAPVGRSGNFSRKIRTFSVVFSIAGSDSRLMPDLSAAVDVDGPTQVGAAPSFRP